MSVVAPTLPDVRIELSVRGPTGDRDIGITLAPSESLRDVLRDLAGVAGVASGERPLLAGRRLRDDDTLASAGLRHGAVLDYTASHGPVAGLWSVQVVAGRSPRQPTPLRRGGVTVGRGADCDVVLTDDRVSRRHARFEAGPGGVTVHDLGTTNGTTVDGVAVDAGGAPVPAGSYVRIGDSLLAVRSSGSVPRAAVVRGRVGSMRLVRAPAATSEPPAVIEAAGDPARSRPGRVQWLAASLPAVAGGALAWATGSPLFLLVAVVSPVVMLAGALGERWHWRRALHREAAVLRDRRAAVADLVADALHAETVARRAELPDVAGLLDTALLPGVRLWSGSDDGLVLRAGTADLPAATRLRDSTTERPAGILPAVPYAVDLGDGVVGIAGAAEDRFGTARRLVAQLVVLHPPSEVTLLLVTDPASDPSSDSDDRWRWCRWLPHLRSGPVDPAAAAALLGALVERRRTARGTTAEPWPGPWTVVVVDALDGDTGALAAVLADGVAWGITGLWLSRAERDLPTACRTSVTSGEHGSVGRRDGTGRHAVLGEHLSRADSDTIGRALAPLEDVRGDGGPPARCRLSDLVPVTPEWGHADGGAGTPLGLGADGPVTIDLVRDGPHALVAGTTGAGKSELLRSLVAGMATRHPPDQLRFLLVDYKGGAAFADTSRLPHTDGVVTDLDAAASARALRALGAELRRRERLFAEAGASDLVAYRVRRGERQQVPRLVIVVDEFAELVAEQPGFVTGLVGVARRGRSLGVHLVLATQRPGTAITAEIRANTGLRIALRVTEPAESVDVIGVPDAASIAPHVPGRCYLRVGDRVTQLQTALVAADPDADRARVELLGPWRQRARDGSPPDDCELARLVDRLRVAATGMPLPPPPWLPPLPAAIPLSTLGSGDGGALAIGCVDLPDEQAQPALRLPWGGGSLLVGRARSGRTSALIGTALAAADRRSPAALHVHAIDRDGSLASVLGALPHLGTAISTATAPDLVARLLRRLAETSEVPTVLLLDDWDVGLAGCSDVQAAHWSDLLASILRKSARNMLVVATGGRSLLLPRVAGSFGTRLLLALDDPTDYGLAGLATGAVPAEVPSPGGGVRVPDGAAFRIAHAGVAPTPDAAQAAVADLVATWSGVMPSRGSPAIRLRSLPDRVGLAELPDGTGTGLRLGLAGDRAEPCILDLVGHRARLLVAGPPRAGRSTALLTLAREALGQRQPVLWWAPPRSPLRTLALSAGPCLRADSPVPDRPVLVVVDDVESMAGRDDAIVDLLLRWLGQDELPVAVAVAGRSDDLATGFHPVAASVRRERRGLLLRPGPLDGDLLGVRITPPGAQPPPGRGVLVADPRWLVRPADEPDEPLTIQVATCTE